MKRGRSLYKGRRAVDARVLYAVPIATLAPRYSKTVRKEDYCSDK